MDVLFYCITLSLCLIPGLIARRYHLISKLGFWGFAFSSLIILPSTGFIGLLILWLHFVIITASAKCKHAEKNEMGIVEDLTGRQWNRKMFCSMLPAVIFRGTHIFLIPGKTGIIFQPLIVAMISSLCTSALFITTNQISRSRFRNLTMRYLTWLIMAFIIFFINISLSQYFGVVEFPSFTDVVNLRDYSNYRLMSGLAIIIGSLMANIVQNIAVSAKNTLTQSSFLIFIGSFLGGLISGTIVLHFLLERWGWQLLWVDWFTVP